MDSRKQAVVLAAVLAFVGGVAALAFTADRDKPSLGLFTSLPIYWHEAGDVTEALDGASEPHWARTALERDYRLMPLDTLDAGDLARLRDLVMAQPRPLAPLENVALDNWVRAGGKVLLFADPMLTAPSRFPIGDKRRPQDVVLLSPILTRWGLDLQFDGDAEAGEATRQAFGTRVATNRPGNLVAARGSSCAIEGGGLVAECRIGKGRALIVADAALLESERVDSAPILSLLSKRAFAD